MMKTYDFDTLIDRSGSGDLKHEALLIWISPRPISW